MMYIHTDRGLDGGYRRGLFDSAMIDIGLCFRRTRRIRTVGFGEATWVLSIGESKFYVYWISWMECHAKIEA